MNEKIMQLMFLTSKTEFIFKIYNIFLKREPDTQGFLHYFKLINEPIDRIKVINDIIFSEESKGKNSSAGRFIVDYLIDNKVHRQSTGKYTFHKRCKILEDKLMRVQLTLIFENLSKLNGSEIVHVERMTHAAQKDTDINHARIHDRRHAFILNKLIKS